MNLAADISVVISAYSTDRWNDLVAAVESLRRQITQPRQVIVVIDHNPDLFRRARAQLAHALVVENQGPRGLSGARNEGIKAASGTIVAFLDDDATAAPDWTERLAAPYRDPRVVAVGGAIDPAWDGAAPAWFPAEFNWVVGCTYRGMPETAAPVRNLIGANMSFRREVFERVGGFRNGIGRIGTRPVGCEETELCIRVRQAMPEARIVYEPRARVSHRVPASRACWRYFRARCWAEGVSKAQVTQAVGTQDGLASERTYTTRVLPSGAACYVADALLHREPAGLARAGALAAGLSFTAAGYVTKVLSTRLARPPILSPGTVTK